MSDTYFDTWPNRTVCDILSEIRTCHKAHNYSYLSGLLEELQSYVGPLGIGIEREIHFTPKPLSQCK